MHECSVIIPCYRDESRLESLLNQLHRLPDIPQEVIVVDAARQTACQAVCERYGARWLPAMPCRGQQLRAGAMSARGEILWFLHADARLPENPLPAMARALANGALGGYFRFRFDGACAWPAPLLETAIALRCRIGVPYGDQGIFARRSSYFAAGGHAPWPLFEEVPLVRNLRALGRFQALTESLWVDPRRWQREGWWRRTWHNRKLALAFAWGVPAEKLAGRYFHRGDPDDLTTGT
ncbi:MAG TPA: TIGR04283 family arsenosugar biosynthesis glycosyltransferase [Nitrosomonas halophila]|nr:TIGR04283 family arsenosugar biosynthesis glycosyltransferase [Nitrosomonas halophila]